MNVRFAETCRENPLELEGAEIDVFRNSVLDGITDKERTDNCLKDIHIGVFFDGTNNNKYRDTAGFSHSNVARLYEVYPGTPAAQKAPDLPKKVNTDGSKTPRPIHPDKLYEPGTVAAADFQYCSKIDVPDVDTSMFGDDAPGRGKH